MTPAPFRTQVDEDRAALEATRRQRVLASMPPEPQELAELRRVSPIVAAAVDAIRVEYGALALRNARLIKRLGRWLFAALGVLAVVLILLGLASLKLSGQQSDTLRDLRGDQQHIVRLVAANEANAAAIQAQRFNASFNSCWESAKRHDDSIGAVRSEIRDEQAKRVKAGKRPLPKSVVDQQIAGTVFIIDRLSPAIRHCGKRAESVVAGRG